MKWKHILDERPKDGEKIVRINPPYDGHYIMGMEMYKEYLPWDDYLAFCKQNDFLPDYWWISSCDFPFPDQPERSKREDHSNMDAVL